METIGIAFFVGAVMFGLGIASKSSSPCSCTHPMSHNLCQHWDYERKMAEFSQLKTENYTLRKKLDTRYYDPHYHCKDVVWAKTPSEQEIVDLIMKATPPLDELKKKFGIL